MLRIASGLGVLLVLSLVGVAGGGDKKQMPADIKELLDKAGSFELFSLSGEPEAKADTESFHGWKVLGKVMIRDKGVRTKLVGALQKGVAEYKTEQEADYVAPRHGIRLADDKRVIDLVVYFTSKQIEVYRSKAEKNGKVVAFTASSPAIVFDEVLRKENVPLAAKKNKK
jgi:hypothetical protein